MSDWYGMAGFPFKAGVQGGQVPANTFGRILPQRGERSAAKRRRKRGRRIS
ncbi:hypothetical protein BSIN_1503 [Burkholderia singularis]|uniref:Uncharacterized protein n=1 Tax=Burkholderia singularis TaxID=1503053 RepID=A0A238GZ54_9BURK|nr:hypothetical protein BSIN_1503 [Burkholderia singularis]